MTKRLEIVNCHVEKNFQEVSCICEDGRYSRFQDVVMVETVGKRFFYLPNAIIKENESSQYTVNRYDPENMYSKVSKKRSIDPVFWVELSELPSLEERLEAERYNEIEENSVRKWGVSSR